MKVGEESVPGYMQGEVENPRGKAAGMSVGYQISRWQARLLCFVTAVQRTAYNVFLVNVDQRLQTLMRPTDRQGAS